MGYCLDWMLLISLGCRNLLTSSSDILRILRLKNEIQVVFPNQTHLPDQVPSLFSS